MDMRSENMYLIHKSGPSSRKLFSRQIFILNTLQYSSTGSVFILFPFFRELICLLNEMYAMPRKVLAVNLLRERLTSHMMLQYQPNTTREVTSWSEAVPIPTRKPSTHLPIECIPCHHVHLQAGVKGCLGPAEDGERPNKRSKTCLQS